MNQNDEWTRQTQERLYRFIFRLQQKRWPEVWEQTVGLALVDGSLRIERMPDADELRRAHYAAHGVRAALALSPAPLPEGEGKRK